METINIVVDVPIKQKECVTENDDGSYTVFIRPDLCWEESRAALAHALLHIANHDFEKSDVHFIEAQAHKERRIHEET